MAAFKLRDAAAGDDASIRAVVFTVLEEYGLRPDPGVTDADLEDVASSYVARGGCFRVIVSEANDIVGCGGLYPIGAEEAEIRKMYLLKDARGVGLGRQLLLELVEAARERGFKRVVVETASELREAIALYKRNGFVLLRREHLPSRCDQAYVLELGPSREP
jgi:putative acetyltransferase